MGTGTPVGPHLVAQPGWMQGRLERRDARGAGPAAVRAEPTRVRDWRWAAGLSDSTSPPRPPRARGPCRSRCLTQRSAGRGGPPHTAALRHESPPPPGTLGQGRGAHSLYLAGLDLILPRGGLQSLQSPRPQSPPWSHLVWFGGRGFSFLLFVSSSFLPTVVCLSILVSLFSVPRSSLPPTAVDFSVYLFFVLCPCLF